MTISLKSITGTAGNGILDIFAHPPFLAGYQDLSRDNCFFMVSDRQTFGKAERLCSTKLISELFKNGNVFYSPHFKVVWIISSVVLPSPAQVAISVPKKIFKLAVARNLIKRTFREAYRKNKQTLYNVLRSEEIQLAFILIYRQNTVPDYFTMENSVVEVIKTLCSFVKHMGK